MPTTVPWAVGITTPPRLGDQVGRFAGAELSFGEIRPRDELVAVRSEAGLANAAAARAKYTATSAAFKVAFVMIRDWLRLAKRAATRRS